ncbi:MAG: choice-of-anchor E domain-containing protein [Planctomycetota bacterium]|nr:choice-of-anchor E domain-containing protein [Planctomycetota bacterium]
MNLRLILYSLALCAVLIPSVHAQGLQHVSFTSTIDEEATNWTHTMNLPLFDPTLGSLETIDVQIAQTVSGRVRIESTDAAPTVVSSTFESFLGLVLPDGSVMQMPIPMANYQDTFTAYDGTMDFAGSSGITHPEINLAHGSTHTLPPPVPRGVFTAAPGATGSMALTLTAFGISSATGAGNVVTQFVLRASATITITYGFLGNTAPTFTTCAPIVMASVGVPVTFQVCASDSDAGATVTLTATGLPAGATFTPQPAVGNPICATFTWTPSSSQVGSTTVTFTATDQNQRTATCLVNLLSAECHLVLGFGLGNTQQLLFGQLFDTQLSSIRRSYPVTMEDMPALPHANLPTQFYAQVLMYNPTVFPSNADQWSQVLRIDKDPISGAISTRNLGNNNGIEVFADDHYDAQGVRRVRFPFTIEGM